MFTKRSRYRKLKDITTTDAKDRLLKSKSLRFLPDVSGTFYHTIAEGDRLDHLSFKYFKEPTKWWRICDANPQFFSPFALLGSEEIVTGRFPLTFKQDATQQDWAGLIRRISKELGVEDVKLEENITYIEKVQNINGENKKRFDEHREYALIITYNRMNLNVDKEYLESILEGFEVDNHIVYSRVGKKIIIPPKSVG